MLVFVVVFLSFCGSLCLSLRSSKQNQQFSGFEDVLLSGFRALSEQQPIAEDYSGFNWLSILLMLAYMGTVLVILLNILIAQMSTTYTQAKRVARLEYDVDRILLLTRMERCSLLVCKRHGMDRLEGVCARTCSRPRVFMMSVRALPRACA